MGTVDTKTLRWWKSSRSGGQGGACVEVAVHHTDWYVRDSKNPAGPVLTVDATAWAAFTTAVRTGTVDPA
ncbi:MAG: DUF397 domain-containing protein [Actinocatenispora sp.]